MPAVFEPVAFSCCGPGAKMSTDAPLMGKGDQDELPVALHQSLEGHPGGEDAILVRRLAAYVVVACSR